MKLLRNRIFHTIILVWLHIGLFITPILVKSLHFHSQNSISCKINCVHKTEDTCSICDFEFVQFLTKEISKDLPPKNAHTLRNYDPKSPIHKLVFTSFSHRAPPSDYQV